MPQMNLTGSGAFAAVTFASSKIVGYYKTGYELVVSIRVYSLHYEVLQAITLIRNYNYHVGRLLLVIR